MKQSKTKTVGVRAKGIEPLSVTLSPFKGQIVNIHTELFDGVVPTSYRWTKDGADIPDATGPILPVADTSAQAVYVCHITSEDGEFTSAECTVKAAADVPAGVSKLFDVVYSDFQKMGFVKVHWMYMSEMDHVAASVEEGKELDVQLFTEINTAPTSELFTMHCALMKCGKVMIQDSHDGYFTMYEIGQDHGVRHKHGAMTNLWASRGIK